MSKFRESIDSFIVSAKRIKKKDYKFFVVVFIALLIVGCMVIKDFFKTSENLVRETEKYFTNDSGFKAIRENVKKAGEYAGFSTSHTDDNFVETITKVDGDAEFLRAIYADTYVLAIDGENVKVTLAGVDVPDDVTLPNGKSISKTIEERLSDNEILLYESCEQTDDNDALFVYLYFSDGTMIQTWLLEQGLAKVEEEPKDTRYLSQLQESENKARESKEGLWEGYFK